MGQFYFDSMIQLHVEKLSINYECPFMVSMIIQLSLFLFNIIIGDNQNEIYRVTLICMCCQRGINVLLQSLKEETSTLVNTYMKGIVLIHLCLKWLAHMTKCFEVNHNVMFHYQCHHETQYYKLHASSFQGVYLKTCVSWKDMVGFISRNP